MDENFNYWEKHWGVEKYALNKSGNMEFKNEIIKYGVKNKRIIEIGSGRGLDAIALTNLGADVYVLDYVEAALQITKKVAEEEKVNLTYILADAKKIPYENNYFDMVYHVGVLEHFKDPLPILTEQYRVLKNGGMIFISVPQKYTVYTIKKWILQLFNKWFAGWETQYSPNELKSIVEHSGFEIIKVFGYDYYPSFLWRIFKLDQSKRWNSILPHFLMSIYKFFVIPFRNSRFSPYTNLCVGIIGLKRAVM